MANGPRGGESTQVCYIFPALATMLAGLRSQEVVMLPLQRFARAVLRRFSVRTHCKLLLLWGVRGACALLLLLCSFAPPLLAQGTLGITLTASSAQAASGKTVVTLRAQPSFSTGTSNPPPQPTGGTINICESDGSAACTGPRLLLSGASAGSACGGSATVSITPGPGTHSYYATVVCYLDVPGLGLQTMEATSANASVPLITDVQPTLATVTGSAGGGNLSLTATVSGAGANAPATGSVSFSDTTSPNPLALGTAPLTSPGAFNLNTGIGPTPATPLAIAGGDFNNDGILDIAVLTDPPATHSASLLVYLGRGDGTFSSPVTTSLGTSYGTRGALAVADLQGVSNGDLVVLLGGNESAGQVTDQVWQLLGNGQGGFTPTLLCSSQAPPNAGSVPFACGSGLSTATTAFTGEPNAAGGPSVSVIVGGGGNLSEISELNGTYQLSSFQGTATALAAIGNNGEASRLATIPASADSVVIWDGSGGSFSANQPIAIAGATALAVGDFNGDGQPDLAVLTSLGYVAILLNNGAGFASPLHAPLTMAGSTIAVGDFNGDGLDDLAVNQVSGSVSILFGKGDGTFQPVQNVSTAFTANPVALAAGDFNNDGWSDLATIGSTAQSFGVLTSQLSVTASLTTSDNNTGARTVQAAYPGDSHFTASSATTTVTLPTINTTLSFAASTNPATGVTSANVALSPYQTQSESTNGEQISFYEGMHQLGSAPLQNGAASFSYGQLPVGGVSLIARYLGDSSFNASSASVSYTATTLTLTASPSGSATAGQPVTLTATVAGTSLAGASAAGAVTFFTGSQTLGTASLQQGPANTATLVLPSGLPVGSSALQLTAVYAGSATYGASQGTLSYTVLPGQAPVCTLRTPVVSAPAANAPVGTLATVSVAGSCTHPQGLPVTETILSTAGQPPNGTTTSTPTTDGAVQTFNYSASGTYSLALQGVSAAGTTVSSPQPVVIQAAASAAGTTASVTTASPVAETTSGTQVTFVCTGVSSTIGGVKVVNVLPSQYGISCSSPVVTTQAGTNTPISITIQTTSGGGTTALLQRPGRTLLAYASLLPAPGLLLLALRKRGRRRSSMLASLVASAAVACLAALGCSNGFTPPPTAPTPAATYYITVMEEAAGGSTGSFIQTSVLVPLTVSAQ